MTRRVVTERDVKQAAREKRPLELPANAIVTPAAREAAEQLGVQLQRRGEWGVVRDGAAAEPASHRNEPLPPPHAVALGADHGGFKLKEALKPVIEQAGFQVVDVGTNSTDAVDYPDFALTVAQQVQAGTATFGIMVDGAGIGSAMVANKVPGIRAALCYDVTTAHNAREHNNANVLTLGGTLIRERLAGEIVKAFLSTAFGGGRHARRVAKIDALDDLHRA